MAIRIPVRSSASEALGGKTIRVPHGSQGAVALPRGSKLIERVPKISFNLDKIGEGLLKLDAVKKAHDKEIEEQRIKNLNAIRSSQIADELDDLVENMKNNNNLATDSSNLDFLSSTDDYESHYKIEADKLIQKYTKLYKDDDNAFVIFHANMLELVRSGQSKMRQVRRKKVIAEGQVAFSIENKLIDKQIDSSSADTVFLALPNINKKIKEIYTTALKNGFITDTDVGKRLSDIEFNAWKKIAKFGNTRVDLMDDEEYVNWQQIIKNIKTGKLKNWGGKTLTDAHKKDLLDWAEAEMKDHKTFVTDRNTRLNTENSKPINEIINKWRSNLYHPKDDDGKALDQRKAIEKKIFESKLTDPAKKALYTEVRTIANDKASGTSDTDSYGSVSQVDKYFKEIILGQSGGQEWLLKLHEDDLISAKGREWLLDKRDKWTTKIDERQKGVIKEYLDKYDGNIDRLSETTLQAYQDYPHFATIFDGRKQQIRATLFELLAEGEKAGISYYSMMEDINSEYYIPFKLDEIYAESWSTISAQLKQTEEFDVATYWQDKQNEALSYFVDADPDTVGQQLYSKYESVATDFDMQQVPAKDATVAVFYKRWLDMPRPPKAVKSDGSKIPINEYENSEEYKKYRKDWIQWWEKGDWNSPNIPKKYKTALGFEDLSKISEK